jgi:hypothetical protein
MQAKQTGPKILSEILHGECCDDCGHKVTMEGVCPNCEEKQEIEQELKNIYKLGELSSPESV